MPIAALRSFARRHRLIILAGFAILAAGGIAIAVSSSRPRSFAQLAYDARHVPVPRGITLKNVDEVINDGPGFTNTHFQEVSRSYSNSLPCGTLQRRWIDALRKAKRSFHLLPEPRLYVASGQMEIVITDRPEYLGITLGSLSNQGNYTRCNSPFIWSFNSPH